jgi:anti-anti-sigma factor
MINIRKVDEATILEITEDLLSPHQAEQLDKMLEEVGREAVGLVIINLSKVQIVNGALWGVIVARAAEFRREKKDIKLVGLAARSKRTIKHMKGDDVVETYETEDDAIQSYSGNVTQVERNVLFGFKNTQ